jgi:DNA-binding response OmpR family regulator
MTTISSWSAVNGHAQTSAQPELLAATRPAPAQVAARSLDGIRVLLVEDSWHIAVAVKSLLENAGVTVDGPASSLSQAEALLRERAPDVAIVDINIKGRMSFGLIDSLVALQIPVIVVSGYDEAARLEGKATAILAKPVRASELLATLARAMATRPGTC